MTYTEPSGLIRTRLLPDFVKGYGIVVPFAGATSRPDVIAVPARTFHALVPGMSKLLSGLDEAIEACQLRDGAVLSFHHHLRNGDSVLNLVLATAARRGLSNLTIAASSIFPVHAPLVQHIRDGVVTRLITAYVAGPVADAVSSGLLPTPVVMQTHGGRAMSIETGRLVIDAAFLAAPAADEFGNLTGAVGPAACGPLGYAMVDAEFARHVVAVTDNLVPSPAKPIDIREDRVDFVVKVESIGEPAGILSGTTRPTEDPVGQQIASLAAAVIEGSGLLGPDFSFQTGAGGVSLAVAQHLARIMGNRAVCGRFAAGGVTGMLCDMLDAGLFRTIFDVQCFDLRAVQSYSECPQHLAMSASLYANPYSRGALVDRLKTMVLGAAEIDLAFNVNVSTGSDGRIIGGSGGHSDTADGAELAIVTTRLASRAGPKVVQQVRCVTTPGSTIDVVVTELGVTVNPRRPDIRDRLAHAGLPLIAMEDLQSAAAAAVAPAVDPSPRASRDGARVIAVVEYRDGSVIDLVT